MSTRIRLRRMGSNKRPFFRVVVADQRSPRDGRFIENIGKYHPLSDPSLIEIDRDRALHWLRVGAQPSNQVRVLLQRVGVWDQFVAERPTAAEGLKARRGDRPDKPKLSKKAQAKAGEAASGESAASEIGVPAGEGTTGVPPAPAVDETVAEAAPADETLAEEVAVEPDAGQTDGAAAEETDGA
jgi:small subunit ribosomal protein S16